MKRQEKYPDTETFHWHNENPKNKITGDCVLRAIATATGLSWDEVLDGLCEVAKKYKYSIGDDKCYGRFLKELGWSKQKQPRKDDNTKYTGEEFCYQLQEDPWIFTGKESVGHTPIVAHIGGNHVVCIKDRRVWDIWDSTDGCIGNYWVKD